MRVSLPDRPGSLGVVATALGAIKGDISALEVVEHRDGYVIDDFMVDLPPGTPVDSLVSACDALPGVEVMWVSHHPEGWGLLSDIELLERMMAHPGRAAELLTAAAPPTFHGHWALLLDRTTSTVVVATELAPELVPSQFAALGELATARIDLLADGWLPGWGETEIAVAPCDETLTVVVARRGGPPFLGSELARLKHLAALSS